MLNLEDLDFESLKDPQKYAADGLKEAIVEIRQTRHKLGKFTLRDSMEAVYGTAYTVQMLGEDGGNDILVEELTALDDLREANGKDRRDVGGNRLPSKRIQGGSKDAQRATQALVEQMEVVEEAHEESVKTFYEEDAKLYNGQANKLAEDIQSMTREERADLIKLLQSQG